MTNDELVDKLYDAYSCLITECNMNCTACDYEFSKPSEILATILDARATLMDLRWIPVTETLPPADEWVLATVKYPDGRTSVHRLTCVRTFTTLWEDETMNNYPVTAWMKMPEPWEGEEE